MARFKLADDEKLITKQDRTQMMGKKGFKYFPANMGALYLTDKRIAFCSTSRIKTLLIFSLYASYLFSSKNIRFEAELNRFDIQNLKVGLMTADYLLLDGENTNLRIGNEFKEEFFKLKQA